ncbi:MAG: ATP-dependent DNA helicase [Candidatus Zambryskibacteria bacterium]|nr:ATP-dependent DNA helicase [Candidatus Zambryskibacteria bacterium]
MISNKEFEERYKKLNKEQKKAVDTIDGPVLVVAGPGTGKTEILTLRIANILKKTDTAPENILALTFTDSAGTNMRKRLSQLIGASAYRVVINTFHSFCNDIIKNYPEYFPTIIGSAHITAVESLSILEKLIDKLTLDLLRPWGEPLHYLRDINKKIEELKREGVTPEKFQKITKDEEKRFKNRNDLYHQKGAYKGKMKGEHKKFERTIEKNKELALIYIEYQKTLKEERKYDWSDMIMEVLHALEEGGDLKLSLQENHHYVLVDEHQDTNNAQNRIIELLLDFHKNPNIFIVGDEKQAIFRFQGASIENFFYFKKLYPMAEVIELSSNYRSSQGILDAAHSLMPSKIPLKSKNVSSGGAEIYVAELSTKSYELYFVAQKIKELTKKEKISPEEIAVLYRSNKEAFAISEALQREEVVHVIESDEDLLSERFVKKLIIIFDTISHYSDDEYLIPLLHIDEFEIDALDLYRLIAKSSKEKTSLYDLISNSENYNILEISRKLKSWTRFANSDNLSEFLERVLRESGILNSMISSKNASAFLGIERLFEEGKRIATNRMGASFKDFVEYINILRDHNLFIKRPKHSINQKAVRLMTAHGAKGLEFEYVFIINATENSFGEKADRDHLPLLPKVYLKGDVDINLDKNSIEDERRLFYVCITRAKKFVYITHASFDENGKEVLASPFVLEIRADRKNILDTNQFEKKIKENPQLLFAERKPVEILEIDRQFINELFHSHPLSVSALNNYLTCPWKYFYRNLLRIPSSPEKHQIYGIAMHSSVEDMWRVMKDREVDKKFLLDSYKRNLGLLGILSQREFNEALEKGNKSLSGWFKWSNPKLTNPVIPEFKINGVELSPGIILSGNLDKVEIISSNKVVVTDYKTGKQRSRNDIEGKTKNSTGDMKRQLEFYKLLLKLHDNIIMQTGIIEFLEPNDSGKYNREEFEISEEEVNKLIKTIKQAVKEITTLSFWDKVCDDKDCQYCSYRKLLK